MGTRRFCAFAARKKEILKYARIKDRIEKLQFDTKEQETLANRIAMSDDLIKDSDSPEYASKVKALIKTKDIDEKDLSLLIEKAEYQTEYMDAFHNTLYLKPAELSIHIRLYSPIY